MNPLKALKFFADGDTVKIIAQCYQTPMSVKELSIKYDIPIAGCYRRVRALERSGLIKCVEERLSDKGKIVKIYRSSMKSAYITFSQGNMKLNFLMDDDAPEETHRVERNLDILAQYYPA